MALMRIQLIRSKLPVSTSESNLIQIGRISLARIAAVMVLLLGFGVTAEAQNFGGAFEGMQNSKDPIQIEADRLEVEDSKGMAVFTGNVNVVQGTTVLKSGKLRVFYFAQDTGSAGPNGNIKRIEAGGKVAVRSGDQKATSQTAIFDMQTQLVTMTGDVSISQGTNIVTGCRLTVNMETNAAKLTPCKSTQKGSGRVRMMFTPSSNSN